MTEEWIKHDGNGMPVKPTSIVEIKRVDGIIGTARAGDFGGIGDPKCWWSGNAAEPDHNIIAYRVVKP